MARAARYQSLTPESRQCLQPQANLAVMWLLFLYTVTGFSYMIVGNSPDPSFFARMFRKETSMPRSIIDGRCAQVANIARVCGEVARRA